ncbi:hypothetical protein [Falsiroseomonas sp. HW251]|uniref:hypothetical protein n=1 Tax=Falsiroseomonas sp. HW251 TaxID=3390998 RepID=UPI003D311756
MRRLAAAVAFMLHAQLASAQIVHLGEVERWLLALGPMVEAMGCIGHDDPLRPGLDAMLRETHTQALRAIHGDYEKGMLAGRLAAHQPAAVEDDADCHRVLAAMARGLLRLQLLR